MATTKLVYLASQTDRADADRAAFIGSILESAFRGLTRLVTAPWAFERPKGRRR